MSELAEERTQTGGPVACRWCGAEDQVEGSPCQQCDRIILTLPRWAYVLPSDRKWYNRWLTRRRLVRMGVLGLVLGFVVWINFPFLPDPVTLLFRKPTTAAASSSSPGQWSMAGWDAQRTRYLPEASRQLEGKVAWSRDLGKPTGSAPTVVDGIVYIGAHFKVLALDSKTGDPIWEQEATGPVHSSLAVADDLVYMGSFDHRILAFDRLTGLIKWQVKTGDAISSSPAARDGMLYFGSWDSYVYALDAATGEQIWRSHTVGDVRGPVALDGGSLYASDNEGTLHILNARTGQKRFRFRTPSPATVAPTLANGLVYFPSGGVMFAVDAGVREIPGEFKLKKVWAQLWIWQVPLIPKPPGQRGGHWRFSPPNPKLGFIAPPAATQEAIYAGDILGTLYARDANQGAEVWSFQAGDGIVSSPVVLGDLVIFGARDGVLYALNRADGSSVWQLSLGAPIEVSPVFAEGLLYVRTTDGLLHAVQ
ncbi:MAG: PQQ-binding-like beta-propeller repeat protein [Chloroflexi bacterium]|nr:PQQ-binding-like beta-propeller repeat protein [Chloroflexota bacterium]